MNRALVVFVKTTALSDRLVEVGIEVNAIFIPVLLLCTPAKIVILSNVKTLRELEKALQSMEGVKMPGVDGLPIDVYKVFWQDLDPDLLDKLNESLANGSLPTSCRSAVITLLPQKVDLNDIIDWTPVNLLCSDYKLLSKALANRLCQVLEQAVHPDRTYCVQWRSFENISFIRDLLSIGKSLGLDFGVVSLDQEKSFDRVEHDYFGMSSQVLVLIQSLFLWLRSYVMLKVYLRQMVTCVLL